MSRFLTLPCSECYYISDTVPPCGPSERDSDILVGRYIKVKKLQVPYIFIFSMKRSKARVIGDLFAGVNALCIAHYPENARSLRQRKTWQSRRCVDATCFVFLYQCDRNIDSSHDLKKSFFLVEFL